MENTSISIVNENTFNSILDPLPPNGGSKTQSVNVLLTDKILTISKFLFNLYKSPAT